MRSALLLSSSAAVASGVTFTGSSGSTWFSSKSSWSGASFPSYPDQVTIADKTVSLTHDANSAADKITLSGTA